MKACDKFGFENPDLGPLEVALVDIFRISAQKKFCEMSRNSLCAIVSLVYRQKLLQVEDYRQSVFVLLCLRELIFLPLPISLERNYHLHILCVDILLYRVQISSMICSRINLSCCQFPVAEILAHTR